MSEPQRIDPHDCGCDDCNAGRSIRAATEAEYERAAMHNPVPAEGS